MRSTIFYRFSFFLSSSLLLGEEQIDWDFSLEKKESAAFDKTKSFLLEFFPSKDHA